MEQLEIKTLFNTGYACDDPACGATWCLLARNAYIDTDYCPSCGGQGTSTMSAGYAVPDGWVEAISTPGDRLLDLERLAGLFGAYRERPGGLMNLRSTDRAQLHLVIGTGGGNIDLRWSSTNDTFVPESVYYGRSQMLEVGGGGGWDPSWWTPERLLRLADAIWRYRVADTDTGAAEWLDRAQQILAVHTPRYRFATADDLRWAFGPWTGWPELALLTEQLSGMDWAAAIEVVIQIVRLSLLVEETTWGEMVVIESEEEYGPSVLCEEVDIRRQIVDSLDEVRQSRDVQQHGLILALCRRIAESGVEFVHLDRAGVR